MKKVWLIILFVLIGLVIAVYLVVQILYSAYEPDDVEFPANPESLAYYFDTYEECRSAFVRAVESLDRRFDAVEIYRIPVEGSKEPGLTTDIVYLPAREEPENLVVLTSGTHGIEGFVGSAVQRMFIEDLLRDDWLDETGILVIHALNPYGMKVYRRVTENNVDLNRNCSADPSLYDTPNDGYARLDGLLNPKEAANHRSVRNRHLQWIVIQQIIAQSMAVLRQAIMQGQYDEPRGVFYGGNRLEPQISAVTPVILAAAEPYPRVMTIDLHAGYGANGILHLTPNPVDDPVIRSEMEEIFSGYAIDWGDTEDFYTISGSYADYVGTLVPGKTYYPMVFEFGTLDSQTTLGSIRSLQIMIYESQGYHHGYADPKAEAAITTMFSEMFFPQDQAWRSKALADAKRLFETVLERL